jgi:hypothetical protein
VLKRLVLSWETAKNTDCNNANRKCSNRNTKCYGGPGMEIKAETPLSPFFSYEVENCEREVNFLDETTGGVGAYSYQWDFGDGYGSQEMNPVHTYRSFGRYEVELLVSDQSGRQLYTSREVVLLTCPCRIDGDDVVCEDWTRIYRAVMNDSTSQKIHWHLDGMDMYVNSQQIEINWGNYEVGQHFLQAYVIDEDDDPEMLEECNRTINVIADPLATISVSSVR